MSWQANGWTANLLDPYKPDPRAGRLRPAHVLVLTMLSIHHDHHNGYAYAQLKRLAAETRLSLREIVNVMNDLEDWQILVIGYGDLPKGKHGNLYYLVGLDDTSEAGPRRRLGGRPREDAQDATTSDAQDATTSDAQDATTSDAQDATSSCTGSCTGSCTNDAVQLHGQLHGQLHDSRARVPEPVGAGKEPATTRSVVEPVIEPAHARAPEAPPRRVADDEEPARGEPPPNWEELAPGIHRGTPGGKGEVTLLKARCPRCERSLPIEEIEGHECELVQGKPLHSGPVTPGNLGSYFRRHRQREPIPAEVRMELAAMAAQSRASPADIPADLRAEHERRLAQAQDRPS